MQIPIGNAGNATATPQRTPVAGADTRIADAVGQFAKQIHNEASALVDTDMAASIQSRQIKLRTGLAEIQARNLSDPDEVEKATSQLLKDNPAVPVRGMDVQQQDRYNHANGLADDEFKAGVAELQIGARKNKSQASVTALFNSATGQAQAGGDPAEQAAFLNSQSVDEAGRFAWSDWDVRKPKMQSEIYREGIMSRMQDDAAGAKEVYEQNKDKLLPTDRTIIENKMRPAVNFQLAQKAVDSVVATLGPQSDRDPINLDVMERALRNDPSLKNNQEAADSARGQIKEWAANRDYSIRQRDNARQDDVYGNIFKGMGLRDLRKTESFQDMSGEEQVKVQDYLRRLADYNLSKNKERIEQSPQAFQVYWRWASNPEALRGTNAAQISQLVPVIGRGKADALMKKKADLEDPNNLSSEKLNTAAFDKWARVAGFDPNDKKDKATLGALRYRMEQIALDHQVATGKKMSSSDYEKGLRQLLVSVEVPGRYWGTNSKSLFEVEDLRSVVVPDAEWNAIEDDFRARGITRYSDDDIRQAYIIKKGAQ